MNAFPEERSLTAKVIQENADQFSRRILQKYSSASTIIKKALTFLEIFKYQIRKLDHVGFCDYELAFYCYRSAQALIRSQGSTTQKKFVIFVEEVSSILESLHSGFVGVKARLMEPTPDRASVLESRLNKLKGQYSRDPKALLARHHSDFITPVGLDHEMRKNSSSTLLIDFRSKREYSYSHINFRNIMNIEPKLIARLYEEKKSPSGQDLEQILKMEMSEEDFKVFGNRHEFDLVVVYNLKFGLVSDDKFDSLSPLLTEDDSSYLSINPFKKLIELLIFRDQFVSSKPKTFPVFLNGGLERWFQIFGKAALTHEPATTVVRTSGNEALKPTEVSHSSYLKSFQDFLSSGIENTESPENNLSKSHPSTSSDFGVTSARKSFSTVGRHKSSDSSAADSVDKLIKSRARPNFSTGLVNLGNSCYMNCILQCLSATPELIEFFGTVPAGHQTVKSDYKEHINLDNPLGSRGVITFMFADLLKQMLHNKGSCYAPRKFKQVVGSFSPEKQFASFEQQDCIEFLNFMLDSLHEDLNQRSVQTSEERLLIAELSDEQERVRDLLSVRLASSIEWERYLKLNFSIIVDLFQGQYVSQLRCLQCETTSSTYNAFSTLSLPIPERSTRLDGQISLFECLDKFVETEILDEDNKWHCPNCKEFTRSTKRMLISRLPKTLIIHLKRFKTENGNFKKLEDFVHYPVDGVLDLTKYWPPVGSYINTTSPRPLDVQKESEILSTIPVRSQIPPFHYHLYGVVNHFGNLKNGHYTSFVKNSDKTRDWSYFDDSKVTSGCSENRVLNKDAYCLFYARN